MTFDLYRDNFQDILIGKNKGFVTVHRVTALWAFSEAALGGILHALKIPFTGLFIGGAAVIFLSLIANFATRKSVILRSTIVVILIKGMVSPYTPLNAYFSVFLQGFSAYILFSFIPNKKFSAFILGVFTITFSAFQKIIVLTLIFGDTLWESINTFGDYVSSEFLFNNSIDFQLSFILIGIYTCIHLIGGIIFGVTAIETPAWIFRNAHKAEEYNQKLLHKDEQLNIKLDKKKSKKTWWKRKSTIVIGLFSATMIIISYLNPQLDDNLAFYILIMLIRSIVITYVWFGLLSPIILRLVKKYLTKKKSENSQAVNQILALFPYFKGIINYSWEKTKELKNYKRIIPFLKNSFVVLLMANIDSYEESNSI